MSEMIIIHVDGYQWLEDPKTEWLGVMGVADVVERVAKSVPVADMVVVTFNPENLPE